MAEVVLAGSTALADATCPTSRFFAFCLRTTICYLRSISYSNSYMVYTYFKVIRGNAMSSFIAMMSRALSSLFSDTSLAALLAMHTHTAEQNLQLLRLMWQICSYKLVDNRASKARKWRAAGWHGNDVRIPLGHQVMMELWCCLQPLFCFCFVNTPKDISDSKMLRNLMWQLRWANRTLLFCLPRRGLLCWNMKTWKDRICHFHVTQLKLAEIVWE